MASPTSSVSSPTTPVVKSNTVIPIALESNHSNAGLTNNLSKPPEIGAEGPDFGWSATSEASHGTPEGGLFKKTAK